jgi:hypothetical protein
MLLKLLAERKEAILRRWVDAVIETYPADSREFLTSKKSPFTNPVGHAIKDGIAALYQKLLEEEHPSSASPAIDKLMRIRAVQDLSPSEAVGFVFALKEIIRDEVSEADPGELRALDSRIDMLGLMLFDVYSKCRERLYEVSVNEIRRRTERLLRLANIVYDLPDEGNGAEDRLEHEE